MSVGIRTLLARGDDLSIERGRLVIQPASGKPVPADWLAKHTPELIRETLTAVGVNAYKYCSHDTGHYGPRKLPGLTMQFQSAVTLEGTYTIFNVELTRSRNTATGQKGSPLPAGHFRTGKRSHLYLFWLSTGLPEPKRLAALHDYLGNLQGILFSASLTEGHANRLDTASLKPLSIPTSVIRQAVLPDNRRTSDEQPPNNYRTRVPDKDSAQAKEMQGLQVISATGENKYGKAVIRKIGDTASPLPQLPRKKPQEQTTDEWLADYSTPRASP